MTAGCPTMWMTFGIGLVLAASIRLVAGEATPGPAKTVRTRSLHATVAPTGITAFGVVGEDEPLCAGFMWRWLRRGKGKEDEWPGTMAQPESFELNQAPDGTVSLWQTFEDFDFQWEVSPSHEGKALRVTCVAVARRDFSSGEQGAQMPQVTWSEAEAFLYPSRDGIAEMPVRGAKPVFPAADWVAVKRKAGLSSLLVAGLTPGWGDRTRVIPGFFTDQDWPKRIYKGDELRMSYLLAPYRGSLELALRDVLPTKEAPRIELPAGFAVWHAHSLERIPRSAAESVDRLSGGSTPMSVSLCRGEVEPFQVVFTPATGRTFSGLTLRFSELRHAHGRARLPATSLSWRRVRYVNRTYADVLEPVERFDTLPGVDWNYPVWVEVSAAPDAQPGDYTGTVSVLSGGKTLASLPLHVHVWDFQLPRECPLNTALFGFWPNHLEKRFGFGNKSDAEKAMMRKGCESLAAHHLLHTSDTVGLVPWRPSVEHLMTPEGEREFIEWCRFWKDRGLRLGEVRVYEEEFWKHYWPIFKARGWDKEMYSGHWDEYSTIAKAREACEVAEKLRRLAPGLRFMSTAIGAGLTVHETADPATDIWSTTPRMFTDRRSFFDARLREGEQVWLYIHHHIRFNAGRAAPRVFFWQLSRLNMDGCCLYGVNVWGGGPCTGHPRG